MRKLERNAIFEKSVIILLILFKLKNDSNNPPLLPTKIETIQTGRSYRDRKFDKSLDKWVIVYMVYFKLKSDPVCLPPIKKEK